MLAASCLAFFLFGRTEAAESMQTRAVVAFLVRDAGTLRQTPPPPGDGYCVPTSAGVPSPPNSVLGILKIGGVDAPAGTLVRLRFDGHDGPAAYTTTAGGYRIDYAAGGAGHEPPCINQVGASMSIVVNGTVVETGGKVGGFDGNPAFRFDLNVP